MGKTPDKDQKESFMVKVIAGLNGGNRVIFYLLTVFILLIAAIVLLLLHQYWLALICVILSLPFIPAIFAGLIKNEEKKRIQIEELKSSIEEKDRYLSDFSHRIRTPLNNFSFIIDYLLDSKPEGSQKEMLETLIASTTNMVEAVNDLTVQSAQEISFEPRKQIQFNLSSALQNTIDIFSSNTGSRVNFEIKQSESIKDNYTGDPITIKQIFLDVFNSLLIEGEKEIKATVSISSHSLKSNKEKVEIKVSADTFVPAFSMTDSDDYSNMAIKLIENLKGTHSISASPGKSELTFVLPLLISAEEEEQSKAAERIKELKTESLKQKKLSDANILLVEDNPTNQKIVLITLKSLVKNIDTAITGKEALDKFGTSTYDVVLMDIQLPIMDGITAAKKIRELERSTSLHTPIIAITANAMLGDKEKCLSAGMDEYLSKPFQPAELIKIIEGFVTGQK